MTDTEPASVIVTVLPDSVATSSLSASAIISNVKTSTRSLSIESGSVKEKVKGDKLNVCEGIGKFDSTGLIWLTVSVATTECDLKFSVAATQAATENFKSHSVTTTLTVNQIDPSFTFSIGAVDYNATQFTINLQDPSSTNTDSLGVFSFAISAINPGLRPSFSNEDVATLSGTGNKTVTIKNAGTATITATQKETRNYNSKSVPATLTVNRITPTFGTFGHFEKTYGTDTSFELDNPANLQLDEQFYQLSLSQG